MPKNERREGAAMVAGREATPADVKSTEHLKAYWLARIPFGAPGSYALCVRELGKYLPPSQVHGYCANLYHEKTGRWPGDHNHRKGDGV